MVKNTIGGNKHKKQKNKITTGQARPLWVAEDKQLYALVIKRLGGEFIQVQCSDGKTRKGHIPGRMRRKIWMKDGDIILVSLRDMTSDDKCDVIHKYTILEAKQLKSRKLIEFEVKEEEEENNVFEEDAESDEDAKEKRVQRAIAKNEDDGNNDVDFDEI